MPELNPPILCLWCGGPAPCDAHGADLRTTRSTTLGELMDRVPADRVLWLAFLRDEDGPAVVAMVADEDGNEVVPAGHIHIPEAS